MSGWSGRIDPERLQPRVVLLDVGDTLLRPEPSWWAVYASVCEPYGVVADQVSFGRAFAEAWQEWEQEGPFEASEEASFRHLMALDRLVFERLGYPGLPEALFRAVEAAFARRTSWFVYDDVMPSLDAMLAAGLRLGVVSNWGWSAPELLHLLELGRHFQAFAISARVGYQKPHPAIFEHALAQLGVRPEEAIHVGDNPEADVLGARRAGVQPVLLERTSVAGGSPVEASPDHGAPVIHDLYELLDLLGIGRPSQTAA